jgi:hypothetical protein
MVFVSSMFTPYMCIFGLEMFAKLLSISAQKVAWLGTDGDPGAALTLHHHITHWTHMEDME